MKKVLFDKIKKVIVKEEREARKERIEGNLKVICDATGWPREKALSEMNKAKAMGISNKTYALAGCYEWTEAELRALSFEISQKEKREQGRADEWTGMIMDECGCDRKTAAAMIEKGRKLGISRRLFAENSCCRMTDDELKEFVEKILKRKTLENLAKDPDVTDKDDPAIAGLFDSAADSKKERVLSFVDKFMPGLDPEEKYEIARDVDFMNVRYNFFLSEYFLYGFKDKTMEERTAFITNATRSQYLRKFCTPRGFIICKNKYISYLHLKDLYKREMIEVKGRKDRALIADYIDRHPVFVFKPLDSSFGNGIRKIDSADYPDRETLLDEMMNENDYILEELIVADDRIKALHPGSINTIRVTTYMDDDGNVTIHLPFFKIGQKGSFVDNGGMGGIFALIDADTGVVLTNGKDENNKVYVTQPDTGVVIKGFQVPRWDELKVFAAEAARAFPDVRYAGWDMALTEDKGWLVVEVNCRTQFFGQQICDEIGKKYDFEKLVNWENIKNESTKYDEIWNKIDKY